ncbi:MAG: DUF3025 domain-containing protein [Burkholderiaceae bacterium]|nr:DUF3025 domain-containing protein [Burkholderiaceae bacterium]
MTGAAEPSVAGIEQVDWSVPWLSDWREFADLGREGWRAALNARAEAASLRNQRGQPLCFVQQKELPQGVAYEAFIAETGRVPTRANLHDFFNALVWLRCPRIKCQLNARQAAEIARNGGVSSTRGAVRDAATLFDENAALFICADGELAALLRAHRWRELFLERRTAFARACEVRLFGHALMEKLVAPYKAITAHAWILLVEPAYFGKPVHERRALIDAAVSEQLTTGLTSADFTPLPVLGIPGWWPQQDEVFYADRSVFRPPRVRAKV